MTYNQWIKQKTQPDRDLIQASERRTEPRFRYPVGKTIYVDNRDMFDRFSRTSSM